MWNDSGKLYSGGWFIPKIAARRFNLTNKKEDTGYVYTYFILGDLPTKLGGLDGLDVNLCNNRLIWADFAVK